MPEPTIVAATLAGLGTPTEAVRQGVLALPSGRRIDLLWRSDKAGWFQRVPDYTFTSRGPLAMKCSQTAVWGYLYEAEGPLPADQIPARSFGFNLHVELNPREVWDAGFRLQESLCAAMLSPSAGSQQDADGGVGCSAAAWFTLAEGDAFLTTDAENQGVRLRFQPAASSNVWYWRATGWLNSPVTQPATGDHWYPNWYGSGPTMHYRWFRALRRWVGGANLAALEEPVT